MTFPAEGVHMGVPNDVYHGDDTAVSRSQLAKLVKGVPGDLKISEDISGKPAVILGNLTDDGLYGGRALLDANYLVNPGLDGRTKAGKQWKADHADDPRQIVTVEQDATAAAMRDALYANPLACEYLGIDGDKPATGALWQSSHVWTDPETGVKCKARPDTLLTDRGIVVDLKTTGPQNLGQMAWTRYCENYRLDLQAGMYLDGCNATRHPDHIHAGLDFDRFVWVVVASAPPYRVEVYECGQAEIEMGREDIRQALHLYKACKAADKWPTSTGKIHEINYRPWALR